MNQITCFCFYVLTGSCLSFTALAQTPLSPFEKNPAQTASYQECISFYRELAKHSKWARLVEAGSSDVSYPIHTFIISGNNDFTPSKARKSGKVVLLINNGIHPGEPDGIDGAMLFARDLIQDSKFHKILDHLVIVIIPVYNIGGALQRNSTSRANQNGPESYGFRGNRQHLDLNRDFIKCDSKNAESFTKIFQYWNPNIFLESHTTDGADYPYEMTLISSQRQKMQADLGHFMHERFLPAFMQDMKQKGLETAPYVNAEDDPANGIYDFLDSPRFSSGYVNLFNTLAFVSESHMLKNHAIRVKAHYQLMHSLAKQASGFYMDLIHTRKKADSLTLLQSKLPIAWEIDTDRWDSLDFKGYTQEPYTSLVTGQAQIKYNRNKPYHKKIPWYRYSKPTREIQIPDYYILPAAYSEVIKRLQWNGIKMWTIGKDSLVQAEFYKIIDYKSPASPYENHFLHSSIKVETHTLSQLFLKGDYLIPTHQRNKRFIVETLEPEAPDSYFAWNFFDGILQRKEYFSAYLFDETAFKILEQNPQLKSQFEQKKIDDPEFAKNTNAMLAFIYNQSAYSEQNYKIYPVARCYKAKE